MKENYMFENVCPICDCKLKKDGENFWAEPHWFMTHKGISGKWLQKDGSFKDFNEQDYNDFINQ
jgi:hypothetical protein